MSTFGHKLEQKDDIYIFRMSGEINAATLPEYRNVIDNLIKEIDAPNKSNLKFIMDYGGIEDVDSAALANILDRLKNDVRCDHKVAFINVPEKFKGFMDIFNMKDEIRVFDSQQDAEDALNA